ncbi:putative Ser/Thr protein kinase [Streptomyces sp. PvR034]
MEVPGRIGGYAVERELGAGGMGTVYLARSRGGRAVAVKVARPELAADPHFRARFRAEVEAARKVGGFHTAPVVDADPEAAAPWLATAYIPGPTLSQMIAEQGPLDEAELRLLGAALAEALQAVHACGLVHRDLKPGNIIMAGDGPRVLDFGIARAVESTRLTATGAAFGTPGFLAPEQAQGNEVTSSADVFALGAVLVAAAGGSAFGSGTPMGLMYRSVHESPDLSALPRQLVPLVAACLAKDPQHRPTPEGLLDLLAPEAVPEAAPETPSVSVPAPPVPDPPVPTVGADGGRTVTAAHVRHRPAPADTPPQATPPERSPTTTTGPRPGRGRLAAVGVGGALLLAAGAIAGYVAYSSDASDGAPFPAATHQLTMFTSVAGGRYTLVDRAPRLEKAEDLADRKDATSVSVTYTGTGTSKVFRQVKIDALYGRLKHPERHRTSMLPTPGVSTEPTVVTPRKEVRFPGYDVAFSCETLSSGIESAVTYCAWADDNTAARLEFTPDRSIDLAAAEARKIRDDIRRPVY